MNKFLGFGLVFILAGCSQLSGVEKTIETIDQNTAKVDNVENSGNNDSVAKVEYTMEEIAKHSMESDCWLLISGKVYDVTEMVGGHPGGKAILEGCGKDATVLFNTRPMGSGTPHSEKANNNLEKFYIGDLK